MFFFADYLMSEVSDLSEKNGYIVSKMSQPLSFVWQCLSTIRSYTKMKLRYGKRWINEINAINTINKISLWFCRTVCKNRSNYSIRSVIISGSLIPPSFYFWIRKICLKRKFARARSQFVSPNTQVCRSSSILRKEQKRISLFCLLFFFAKWK